MEAGDEGEYPLDRISIRAYEDEGENGEEKLLHRE